MDAVLQIVDSQAQKIAEQANELIEAKGANILLNEQNENLRNRVAEQAKEIEQARTIADEWREKAGSKYDPFPWETTDSKEVAR
jgi:regulator of replication initiation timing